MFDKTTLRLTVDERCFLRPLAPEDVTDAYVQGLRDPEVIRFLLAPRSTPQTRETVTDFVRFNQQRPTDVLFGVFIDGGLRGTVRLHDLERGGVAWMGTAIFDRAYWGQGWAHRCLRAAGDWALAEVGVAAIRAGIEPDNLRSRKAFARGGFELEEEWVRPDGYRGEHWIRRA